MIALLVFHDGRNEYLKRTLESFIDNVMPIPEHSLLINDSKDSEGIEIAKEYGLKTAINTHGGLGIFRSVELAWKYVRENWPDVEFIFHQENDFEYNQVIDVKSMLEVLRNKHVMQVALKRQAWYKHELKYGDFMRQLVSNKPNCMVDYAINGVKVVTHREFFTNNPSIYRISTMPQIYESEYLIRGHFKKIDTHWTCCYLGRINDKPLVTHIGEIKV
jgi:hypothetical protein